MQEIEKEQEQAFRPADPNSKPEKPTPILQSDIPDDDPDEIFFNAIAEIDTQPLLKKKKGVVIRFMDVFQVFLCSSLIFGSMAGIIWQVITYPKTLVILYAVEKPAHLTATLDIPTRTLAPRTVTRSLTTPTTGHGHQDARAASGTLTFYNGNANPQTIAIGTVFTGSDGIQVSTNQSVTIPAANPPSFGQATMTATSIRTGSRENIHAYDITRKDKIMSQFEEDTLAALTLLFTTVAELGEMNIRDMLTPGKYDQFKATLDDAYDSLVKLEDALDNLGMKLEYHHWRMSSAFEELKPLLIQTRTRSDAALETFQHNLERKEGFIKRNLSTYE